jgi:teichoic acid transport system permease protein
MSKTTSEFSSDTDIRVLRPFKAKFPNIPSYLKDMWARRAFIRELSKADRENEHLETFFGRFWNVLSPLLMALVYYLFIFVLQGGHQGADRFLHLMLGIFIFEFVSTAAMRGANSIVSASILINNTQFPRALLPLTNVLTAWSIFLPSLGVYALAHLAIGNPISVNSLQAIPALFLIFIFATGLSFFASAAQVYFRDTAALMPFVIRILLFISPVLYFPEIAKEVLGGKYLALFNPIFCMVEIFSGSIVRNSTFDLWTWIIAIGWSFSTLIIGFCFLITREGEFAARL